MDAGRGVDKGVFFGQAKRRLQVGRSVAGPDGQQRDNTGIERPLNGSFAITVELRVIQVAVGIDQLHLLKPRARRNVFQETGKHRSAAF